MKWAGSRDKIFSPSGRGRAFFLTFLFIERFDRWSMSDIEGYYVKQTGRFAICLLGFHHSQWSSSRLLKNHS